MEHFVELSPFQIRLNLEMLKFIPDFLKLDLDKDQLEEEISYIITSKVQDNLHLSKVIINKELSIIREKIIEQFTEYIDEGKLERITLPVYSYFIEKSRTLQFDDYFQDNNFIQNYMRSVGITQLIEILSQHISNLITYSIKISFRSKVNEYQLNLIEAQLFNIISAPNSDLKLNIIKDRLNGQYWYSSRHLDIVSNKYLTLKEFKEKFNILNHLNHIEDEIQAEKDDNEGIEENRKRILSKINRFIPERIRKSFLENIEHLQLLNYYKELDAQIQIRAAYVLRIFIHCYLKQRNMDYGTISNPEEMKKIIIMLCMENDLI